MCRWPTRRRDRPRASPPACASSALRRTRRTRSQQQKKNQRERSHQRDTTTGAVWLAGSVRLASLRSPAACTQHPRLSATIRAGSPPCPRAPACGSGRRLRGEERARSRAIEIRAKPVFVRARRQINASVRWLCARAAGRCRSVRLTSSWEIEESLQINDLARVHHEQILGAALVRLGRADGLLADHGVLPEAEEAEVGATDQLGRCARARVSTPRSHGQTAG